MRTLVTVASKHGASAEIGEVVAAALSDAGLEVDSVAPERVADLGRYDAIVIGSAVYAGGWLPPARDLAHRLSAERLDRPIWLFSSGPIGDPPLPAGDPPEGAALAEELRAREHRTFGGRLDRSKLGFVERAITAALKAPDGDFRDWDAVREWAGSIAGALRPFDPATRPVAGAATRSKIE
jgi:menaquinone-dependent protoporphyrinogen oxidase